MQFSVVIPTFNSAGFVEECVESIFAQGRTDVEVIVVDDCSTDSTREIVLGLQERHGNLSLLRTGRNGGPGLARNAGIEAARGRWVLFVDSDDCLAETALGDLSDFIARQDGATDVVAFDWSYVKKDDDSDQNHFEGRVDAAKFGLEKQDLLEQYLKFRICLLYTSPSPRDKRQSRMPSSA